MCSLEDVRSPYAIQDFYVDDAAVEVRDGNVFVTYCQTDKGEVIGAVRLITSLARMRDIRSAVTKAVQAATGGKGLRSVG